MKERNVLLRYLSFILAAVTVALCALAAAACTPAGNDRLTAGDGDGTVTQTPGKPEADGSDPEPGLTDDPVSDTATYPISDNPDVTGAGTIALPETDGDASESYTRVFEEETKSPDTRPLTVFSHSEGFYEKSFTLTLSLPDNLGDGAYAVYTLDCSEPSPDGDRITGEKTVPVLRRADCTVVRAAVFAGDGSQIGPIVTKTYLKSGQTGLMTVSVVTDDANLSSKKTGILANRSGKGSEWERPASVEMFGENGECLISQDAGIRLCGAGSRSFDPPSFRITARKTERFDGSGIKYSGKGKFSVSLFEGDSGRYDSFVLRNGGNDSLYASKANHLRMNMLRDAIADNLCYELGDIIGANVFAQKEKPVSVWLNGEYYGVFHLKQDFDEHYIENEYGPDAGYVTIIKGKKDGKRLYYQVESGDEGELDAWTSLCSYAAAHALAKDYDAAYEKVTSVIDMDNMVAYFAVMTYYCNTDWPQNNTMVWRYTGEKTDCPYTDGKWRFVIRDMDLCFGLHDANSQSSSTTYTMADTDTLRRLLLFYWDGNGYTYDGSTGLYPDDTGFEGLFDFVMRSGEFREKFRTVCEILMSDRVTALAGAYTDTAAALCAPEIKRHITRWKSVGKIYDGYTFETWENTLLDIKQFLRERPGYFKKYLDNVMKKYG